MQDSSTQEQTSVNNPGFLYNPLSGRVRHAGNLLNRIVSDIPHATFREASSSSKIEASVDSFMQEGVDLLVIAGGDGTVQAVLNYLFSRANPEKQPLISILPGGTTNMTAADLGIRGSINRNLEFLRKYILEEKMAVIKNRRVLCIEQENEKTVHGMFFGAGMIVNGVKYFHRYIRPTGMTGEKATIIVVLRYLVRLLLNRLPGETVPVKSALIDGSKPDANGNFKVVLASTLDRLLLGMRPYWGTGPGNIHTTLLGESPGKLWRSLIPLLRGHGKGLHEKDGYYSGNHNFLELKLDGHYIVDGELFFSGIENGPLRISTVGPVRFLCPGTGAEQAR